MIDVLLTAVVWVIAVVGAIVALVAVFGFWGWASFHDAVEFEDKLEADPNFPTDHARRLPEIDLPLAPREDDDDEPDATVR